MKIWIELVKQWVKDNTLLAGVGAAIAFVLFVCGILVSLPSSNTQKPPPAVTENAVKSTLPEFAAQDGVKVLLNMYTYVDEACYSNGQFFVHFEDGKDENWSGWYWFKEYKFSQLANGTWYHPMTSSSNLSSITNIDTKGLECIKSGAP